MMVELKRNWLFGSATLVVIALILAFSIIAFREDERQDARLTAEVPASIVGLYVRRGQSPQTGATAGVVNVLIEYRYEIEGKQYARQVTMSETAAKSFKVGQPAKVCYNPGNPDEAKLFSGGHQCGR
jgi:hypothetical protein